MTFLYDLQFSHPGYIFYLIHHTNITIWRALEARLSGEHITLSQFRILFVVRYHNKSLTPAEIGRYIFRESQTVTMALNRMQKNDYLQKVDDPEDKRKVRVQITERGEQVLKKHLQWMADIGNEFISCFSKDEYEQFQEYLKRSRDWAITLLGADLVKPKDKY